MKRSQMNPRQRQGLLLVVIAAAGLLGVFLLIANYVSTISKQVGPKISVLTLVKPVAAYQPVTSDMLGETSLPQKWAPSNALQDPATAQGLITQVPLPTGTVLEQGMLTQQPALQGDQQEIAILVDAETGVAGQVTPGSVVNVIATYGGASGLGNIRPRAQIVVIGAKVLGVGTSTSRSAGSGALGSSNQGVPVTLSLTPRQILKVGYAESFAAKVRLSLVAPGFSGRLAIPAPYSPLP